MKRFYIGVLLLASVLLFSACSPQPASPDPYVSSVEIYRVIDDDRVDIRENEVIEIVDGEFVNLGVEVAAYHGATAAVTWDSKNEAVAEVETTGYVSSLAPGTTTITARSVFNEDVLSRVTIVVTERPEDPEPEPEPDPEVLDIYITRNGTPVASGTQIEILMPGDNPVILGHVIRVANGASPAVVWQSTDTDVVTVTNGIIVPTGRGSAVVTVQSVYDETFVASIPVVVSRPVNSVTIFPPQVVMYVDDYDVSFTAMVSVARQDVSSDLIWTSTNTDVLVVRRTVSGVDIVPRSAGTATVVARSVVDRAVFDEVTVRVLELDGVVTSIEIDPENTPVTVVAGNSFQLRALLEYEGRVRTGVLWTSSNPDYVLLDMVVTDNEEYNIIYMDEDCPDAESFTVIATSEYDPSVTDRIVVTCSNQ